jgi:hypothetical protein
MNEKELEASRMNEYKRERRAGCGSVVECLPSM